MLVARELLLLHSDQVITVPVVRPPARVWVISMLPQLQREDANYDQPKKLKNLAMRIKSKGLMPIKDDIGICPPPSEVWQEALQFSIQARMAPNWSRVGLCLFYGRDFLNATIVDAVKPQLRTTYDEIEMYSQSKISSALSSSNSKESNMRKITEEKVYLYLEGCQFRWRRIELNDLHIRSDKLLKYVNGEINSITYHDLGVGRLCVLPNLTIGRLLSITRNIQQCKDITDWASMKRYWKNLYGYRLPADEKDGAKFYCNIVFDQGSDFGRPSDRTIFCYPESCVRLHEPTKVFRHLMDRDKIVDQFLIDLRAKVPEVCGLPLRFPIEPHSSAKESGNVPNKTLKRPFNMIDMPKILENEHIEKKRLKLPGLLSGNEE